MADQKTLRIGALIRVSTERQEKQGESLAVQHTDIERVAPTLGGAVVQWYGGREHATPGHEKAEVDRLLADAAAGVLDAVMVNHPDRWSRDNAASQWGLDLLKEHGVKFFVLGHEYNLLDPMQRFYLGMAAEVGRMQAAVQRKKSLESRIHRARRGVPTAGALPPGRTYDRGTSTWGIIKEYQWMIEDAAERYLGGESLTTVAEEYAISRTGLYMVLKGRCGDTWNQNFNVPEFGIKETVPTPVPRLLPEETIEAMRRLMAAQKCGEWGKRNSPYLLTGMVYCRECGVRLTGRTQHRESSTSYYSHGCQFANVKCPVRPRPHVRCQALEDAVLRVLFDLFGNPAAVARAVEQARPDPKGDARLHAKLDRLRERAAKLAAGRDKVMRLARKDLISDEEAEAELAKTNNELVKVRGELDSLDRQLVAVPAPEDVKSYAVRACNAFAERTARVSARRRMEDPTRGGSYGFERMSWADRRALVEMVFVGRTSDGKPAGIYIEQIPGERPHRARRWRFCLRGLLLGGVAGTTARVGEEHPDAGDAGAGAPLQTDLLAAPGQYAVPSTGGNGAAS